MITNAQSTPTQGNNSKELIQRHIILLDDAQSYLHEMLQKNKTHLQVNRVKHLILLGITRDIEITYQ